MIERRKVRSAVHFVDRPVCVCARAGGRGREVRQQCECDSSRYLCSPCTHLFFISAAQVISRSGCAEARRPATRVTRERMASIVICEGVRGVYGTDQHFATRRWL